MKHPANQEFYTYWNDKRGGAPAPDRADFEPGHVRRLLGDIFVLSCDADGNYPFRVAGTRLCALLGRDLKGESFTGLFSSLCRDDLCDLLDIVTEETQPTIAGVTAQSASGGRVDLELLLLPFSARWQTPLSLTGLLAPLGSAETHAFGGLSGFRLSTWRHLRQDRGPRDIRKWSLIRGLTLYEGLR